MLSTNLTSTPMCSIPSGSCAEMMGSETMYWSPIRTDDGALSGFDSAASTDGLRKYAAAPLGALKR